MPLGDQTDFWKQDTFGIQRSHGPHAPVAPTKVPHAVPDERELFTLQRQLLRAINAMDEKTDPVVRREVEKSYKTIRRYLDKYVAPSGPGGGL